MSEKEQVKPLAPAAHRISVDEDDALSMELKKRSNRKYIKCCGCIAALLLIQAVTILVLLFTVFHIKDPVLRMNSVEIKGLDRANNATLSPATNFTVIADVSVKNPNVASFKFSNTTTTICYDGVVVGEARNPPGVAKARRTLRLNVTVDVMLQKILDVPRLSSDLSSEALAVSSYTRIDGRVKILKVIKKHVVVKLNCTMNVNIRSQAIQDQICNGRVLL